VLITPSGRSVDSTGRSQILVHNRDFCIPHLHSTPPLGGYRRNIAMTFGTKKTRIVWLPDGEKFEDTFIRFDRIHERDVRTDVRTDSQTPHGG